MDMEQVRFSYTCTKSISLCTQINLSVESNQNVELKKKSVEFRIEKCGVQNFENMYMGQKCSNHLVYFQSARGFLTKIRKLLLLRNAC